ncbi:MAG: T9SS type A sorting domain-containing protein [candidate division Zixibacteria bacterium]|nr:T9SS type A sorting domain-containing protein [candidate division Zixibacteria bacterium]
MCNNKRFIVLAGCFFILGMLLVGGLLVAESAGAGTCDPPFVIHYGLNDSHGRSWVRENDSGVVGITYVQHDEGSYDEGALIYKTIMPDGSKNVDTVTTGKRLEKSVLLYDALAEPHIFVAQSSDTDQVIDHYFKVSGDQWQCETIIHFKNEGGKFIYELSADTGPDHSFHLLILKSRSNVDSADFMNAWINSYLYHLTNKSGSWEKELVCNYDMPYTYDMCIKTSIRQDMKVDKDGYVHVAFGVQISGTYDPSVLKYATNKTGTWHVEKVLNNDYGPVDDAGWFPSLCLDNNGVPYIACIYLNRVLTHSVTYSTLFLLKRLSPDNWHCEIVCAYDDGYHGWDGRDYTGALCHLVFDDSNRPHIIFSDIAATHWDWQRLNVGYIRYGVFENDAWNISTIYRQPLPTGFFRATEMLWMCLVVSDRTNKIHIIGQEIEITGEFEYTCRLLEFAWDTGSTDVERDPESALPESPHLFQNYPNPFNPATIIEFELPLRSHVSIVICNALGQVVTDLVDKEYPAGSHQVSWDGLSSSGQRVSTGVYFYRLVAGDFINTRKMILLK